MSIAIYSMQHFGRHEFNSERADVKSLNSTCKLSTGDNVEIDTRIFSNEMMQERIITAMVSQYRVEAMIGDSSSEESPIYVPEW